MKRTPLNAIHDHCLECCGWDGTGRKPHKSVRQCQEKSCHLHPYRQGRNPYHHMSRLKRSLDNLRRGSNMPGGPTVFEAGND